MALNLVAFILQSLLMLGIIIAMNFSVTQLRAMVSNSPWVPSTPLQVGSLWQSLLLVFGVRTWISAHCLLIAAARACVRPPSY